MTSHFVGNKMFNSIKWTSKDFSCFNKAVEVTVNVTTRLKILLHLSTTNVRGVHLESFFKTAISKDWASSLNCFTYWLETMSSLRNLLMILAITCPITIFFRGKRKVWSSKSKFLGPAPFSSTNFSHELFRFLYKGLSFWYFFMKGSKILEIKLRNVNFTQINGSSTAETRLA